MRPHNINHRFDHWNDLGDSGHMSAVHDEILFPEYLREPHIVDSKSTAQDWLKSKIDVERWKQHLRSIRKKCQSREIDVS